MRRSDYNLARKLSPTINESVDDTECKVTYFKCNYKIVSNFKDY